MFGFFIIRKLFDISCISDLCGLFQNYSVVLAECGHFVVTWSVQKYSCGHLVCAGMFLHSPVLCGSVAGIFLHSPVFTQVCRNMPAEPEPFDPCACSCMNYLVGNLKPDLCKN